MGRFLTRGGAMRLITRKASAADVELPSSTLDPKCKACPAYHIKGMCNTCCRNVGDHTTHTREQDIPLWEWAVRAMPEITAPSTTMAYDAGRGAERLLPVPPTNPAPSVRTRALSPLSNMLPRRDRNRREKKLNRPPSGQLAFLGPRRPRSRTTLVSTSHATQKRSRDSDGRSLCGGDRDADILLSWRT